MSTLNKVFLFDFTALHVFEMRSLKLSWLSFVTLSSLFLQQIVLENDFINDKVWKTVSISKDLNSIFEEIL